MEHIRYSGNTDPGRKRRENQDAYILRPLWGADKALLAVIDGVGGYAGGEQAAAIAKECIEHYMQKPRGNTLTMLREALLFANNRIYEERKKDHQLSEMCCVLTAAVADVAENALYFAHVGDTRLYRYRGGELRKLTKDHSVVGLKEDAGDLSEPEAMTHPHRNQILRDAGSALHRLDDTGFMDFGREEFLPGDQLLLCSDGLTDMVPSGRIAHVLATRQSPEKKISRLITLANEAGGHDNITVLLVQRDQKELPVQENPAPPAEGEQRHISDPVPTAAAARKRNKRRGLALLVLILVAAAGWQLFPQNTNRVTEPPNGRALPIVRGTHPAISGPAAPPKTDTLRITDTRNLEDLVRYADSTGSILVLMPENKSKRFAAVEITRRSAKPGDTLLIRNLRLMDFETGFNVHIPVLLKTENLVFENILYPFSYLYEPGNRHTSVLFMNTARQ